MDIKKIEEVFNKYVNLFDMDNVDINYKYTHSYRVKMLSNYIAKSLNLSDEDIELATVIGLLHDIGRFKQYEMFGNFKDSNIDHADLGVKILFEDNLIEKFNIDKKYYKIIEFSIKNHNKFEIENVDDKKFLLQAKIIRDADKIDILKAYTIFKDRKLKECDENITDKVKEAFLSKRQIKFDELKNSNDNNIFRIAFIFDINFKASLELIKKEKVLEKTFNMMEHKDIFKPYFDYLMNYLEEEISNVGEKI